MNLPATQQVVSPTLLLKGNEARAYAEDLAKSGLLNSFFQGSVANVLFAMELGKSYNLEPVALLQNIHVFETWKDAKVSLKASLSANLMVHLARHAGHIVTTRATPAKASCTIVRGDTIFAKMLRGDISGDELEHYSNILSTLKEMDMDPKAHSVTESVWTMDKAHTAGLVKEKGNWAKYPHAMLAARAKADAVRMACEEVLISVNNRAEQIAHELGNGFVDRDGRAISTSWTHLADELGGSINEEDGTYVPSGNAQPRKANVITATAPAPAPPAPRSSVTNDADLAKADIAAQVASDPSQAGWASHAQAAPTQSAPSAQEAQVRKFVEGKAVEDVISLLNSTAKSASLSEEERDSRMELILATVADVYNAEQLFQVYLEYPDVLNASVSRSDSSTVAELIQEIALNGQLDKTPDERLKVFFSAYEVIKQVDRMDNSVRFYSKTKEMEYSVSLGDAMKIIAQPLLKQTQS